MSDAEKLKLIRKIINEFCEYGKDSEQGALLLAIDVIANFGGKKDEI